MTTTERIPDPLLVAVDGYFASLQDFERDCPDDGADELWDAFAEATYSPRLDVLERWDQPATSRAGAMAALRFILEFCQGCEVPPGVEAMARAALGYLEKEGRR